MAGGPRQRDGRPLVACGRLGDAKGSQPVAQSSPALRQVKGDGGKRGGQCADVTCGKDFAYTVDEIDCAADDITDHGDQAAGHSLVDHESPLLDPAWQRKNVTAGVPARQLCLVDEAETAHGKVPFVAAHLLPQRPVAEHQQVKRRTGTLDGPDEIQGTLQRDQLAGKDDRWAAGIKAKRNQPLRT